MASDKSARERFVEAMRDLYDVTHETDMGRATVEAACDAFADAECEALRFERRYISPGLITHDHESCRAAIREEVFGND